MDLLYRLFWKKNGGNFPGSLPVNSISRDYFLAWEVIQLFDWAVFLKIILAVFQAIFQNLPVV
jgi:hypothetical protein